MSRKAQTRRRLIDAAREEFTRLGYDGARPQQISKRAGVANGTFYTHFDSKLDCFATVCDTTIHEFEQKLRALEDAQTLPASIDQILQCFIDALREDPAVLKVQLSDYRLLAHPVRHGRVFPNERLIAFMGDKIEQWRELGWVTNPTRARLLAFATVGMVREAIKHLAPHADSAANLAKPIRELMLSILTPSET